MIILGLDPGLTHTGWGIVKQENNCLKFLASGTLKSNAKETLPQRLVSLYEGLQDILKTWTPDTAAVEETFVNTNAQSTLKLGQGRAISLLVPALHGIPVEEYAANLVKKSVVGTGHATKEQIMHMIKVILPSSSAQNEHEADALAVAICHAHHREHNALKNAVLAKG